MPSLALAVLGHSHRRDGTGILGFNGFEVLLSPKRSHKFLDREAMMRPLDEFLTS